MKPNQLDREQYRIKHGLMENEKALSYHILEKSKIYKPFYEIYVNIISCFIERRKGNIKILNIGSSSGVLESLLIDSIGCYIEKIDSIDNSLTFKILFSERNKNYINNGTIIHHTLDVLSDSIELDQYDVIISRDLNHHLVALDYLKSCFSILKNNGIMIMDDLRFDAEYKAIKEFNALIFQIKEYNENNWLLFHKILGLNESFAVAYTQEEVIEKLKETNFHWNSRLSSARYHFILTKSLEVLKDNEELINFRIDSKQ